MSKKGCSHRVLCLTSSPHAVEAGFKPLSARTLASATTNKLLRYVEGHVVADGTFPAPLVLPDDALAMEPDEREQSLRSWVREKHRNPVTDGRRVIYIARPPSMAPEIKRCMSRWTTPLSQPEEAWERPRVEQLINYLAAFYHGMQVRDFPRPLRFVKWDDNPATKKARTDACSGKSGIPRFTGLATEEEVFGIRTRACNDGTFAAQLNLNDVLDMAIAVLPADTYAMLMMLDHDLYEDDEDDFTCGRAFGGSRICCVSSARYNPALDARAGIDRQHAWPASHCDAFVREKCGVKQRSKTLGDGADGTGAPRAAVSAFASQGACTPENLWLERVCRTASHELGHCFALAHCRYYACVMQGTASVGEDVRQPPYLCPVDTAKITRALGCEGRERDEAMLRASRRLGDKGGGMFAAYAGWLAVYLEQQQQQREQRSPPRAYGPFLGSSSNCPILLD